MSYQFRFKPEALWFVGVAALTAILQILITFDPAKIENWQTWAIALGAAAVRAAAGAAIHALGSAPEVGE